MSKLKDFSSYGSEPSQQVDLKGEPLTLEHLNKVVDDVKNSRGRLREPVLSSEEFRFYKAMIAKGEANWTDEEKLKMSYIIAKCQL